MKPSGLSVHYGVALILGAVLGTGVISLPGLAARAAGPASLVAWVGLMVLSVPLSMMFAALGARHPDGGGVATYVRLAFGERAAAMIGWAFYLTIPLGAPVAAGFAGAYVADALGGGQRTTMLTVALIVVAAVAMNWFGIRTSGRLQLGFAGMVAVLLLAATLAAAPHAHLANLRPFAPHGWMAVGHTGSMLVWAFAGWEVLGSLSAEFRDPARDVPRATALAVSAVAVLYLGVAAATVTALGSQPGPAPLSDLLRYWFGPVARPLTTVIAVLLTLGAINAYFAGGSRLGAALARDGALPGWLAAGAGAGENPRRSLQVIGVIALGAVAVLAGLGLPTDTLLLVATGTFSLVFLAAAAAALRLLPRGGVGWACALVSLAASTGLLVLVGVRAVIPVVLALGGLAFTALRRRTAGRAAPARARSSS